MVLSHLGFWCLRHGINPPRFQAINRYWQKHATQRLLERLKVDVLLDVGANRGQFARSIRRGGYRGEIISFEPIQAEYQKVATLSWREKKWRTFNTAIGSENGQKAFNVITHGNGTVYSSFLEPAGAPEVTQQVTVPIQRLDMLLPHLVKPQERVFCKSDTQGYDMEVLKGAGDWLQRFVGVQVEVSVKAIYQGTPHFTQMIAYLETAGFSLMELRPIDYTDQGAVLEYDCMMARLEAL